MPRCAVDRTRGAERSSRLVRAWSATGKSASSLGSPRSLGSSKRSLRRTPPCLSPTISKQLLVTLRPLVPELQANDRELADQLRRAAQSVLLNLAEGQRYQNGNRRKHYEIAQGSANEVKAALDAAEAWGWIEERGKKCSIGCLPCCGSSRTRPQFNKPTNVGVEVAHGAFAPAPAPMHFPANCFVSRSRRARPMLANYFVPDPSLM